MAVADNGTHALKSGDFMRGTLRVTASNNDLGLRIQAANAANKGAGAAVGLRRNAASIQNDEICRIRCCRLGQATVAQSGGDGLAVRAAGPASEVLNVICFHIIESINATLP